MNVKLTKLTDDIFEGKHPNNILEGYTRICTRELCSYPKVGESCYVGSLGTSMVTEILEETSDFVKFKTLNSTYLLELNYINL